MDAIPPKALPPGPSPRERQVVPLAETRYAVREQNGLDVVLQCGKELERWCRADVLNKGYAICIEGLEYEFQGVLK